MNGWGRRLGMGLVLTVLATGFAWLNGTERVDLHLGLVRLRDVPLPAVVFGTFLLGMLSLFLASLRSELRTRRRLRSYRQALGAEPGFDPDDAKDRD